MAKKKEITIRSSAAEYLTYVLVVGEQESSVEMRYEDENVWLTQKMMAQLYDVAPNTINEHIKKIFDDSELQEVATIRNFRIVQTEGTREVSRDVKHYSLQMIIAVDSIVQNKMHYSIHGQTAAELIVSRADAQKENIGLTSWDAFQKRKIQYL